MLQTLVLVDGRLPTCKEQFEGLRGVARAELAEMMRPEGHVELAELGFRCSRVKLSLLRGFRQFSCSCFAR